MNRTTATILLMILAALMQSFLFENLTFGISLLPLVYIVFIILLPMQKRQLEMIMWGLALGVTVDLMTGMAGLNTIATLAVSYLRIYILNLFMGQDIMITGGVPTRWKVGALRLTRYIVTMVALHSFIYFAFESMNPLMWQSLLTHYLLSVVVALLFSWLFVILTGMTITRYYK